MTGAEILTLIEFAGTVRELVREEPADRTAVEDVIKALRIIYFTPGETISLLEQIANGERPSADRIAAILPEFNDKEWQIIGKLRQLNFQALHATGDFSIRQCRILEEIGHGKMNLRASIQDFLNEAMTTGRLPSASEAQLLLGQVRQLNSAIEDAEEGLRQ